MDDQQLRDLQQLASELEELTTHLGWPVLVHYATNGDGMIAHHQSFILNGSCKNPEEYQKYAGWLAGANAILNIPQIVGAIRDRESLKQGSETGEES